MGRGDGVVTLVGIKTVVRRGKAYRYFRAKGAPMIRLPDLPIDHPDFLRAYADARKAAPERAPAATGSFAAMVRSALSSAKFHGSQPATRAMFRRHCDALTVEYGQLPARGLRAKHIRANVMAAKAQGHRLRTWRFLCGYGVSSGLLDRNEALDVAMPKGPTTQAPPMDSR